MKELRSAHLWFSVFIFWTSIFFSTQASEVDSWSGRLGLLESEGSARTTRALNDLTDDLLERAMREVNNKTDNCNPKALYQAIYRNLGGFLYGKIENIVRNTDLVEKYKPSCFERSVYGDFSFVESFPFFLTKNGLGATFNLGGNIVGTDKLGHFFAQGYTYFQKAFESQKSIVEPWALEKALHYGEESERLYFGLQTTGIYSYGDLSANYEGMNFWSRLLPETMSHQAEDGQLAPYFICQNGKFAKYSSFDWMDYVSAAWDEGVNCNEYRTPVMAEKVQHNILALAASAQEAEELKCPPPTDQCQQIFNRYRHKPRVLLHLLSPDCALSLKDHLPRDIQAQFAMRRKGYYHRDSRESKAICQSIKGIGSAGKDPFLGQVGNISFANLATCKASGKLAIPE